MMKRHPLVWVWVWVWVRIWTIALACGLSFAGAGLAASPEKISSLMAEVLAADAESATRLSLEGRLLYEADERKLDGWEYCGSASRLIEVGELRQGIREASKALFLGIQSNKRHLVASAKRDLAVAYIYAGHLELARKYASEAIDDVAGAPYSYDRRRVWGPCRKILGDVAARGGKLDEALKWYDKALSGSEGRYEGYVRASRARLLIDMKRYEDARKELTAAEKGLGAYERQLLRRAWGDLAMAEQHHDEAATYFREAAEGAAGPDAAYHRMWAFDGLGRAFRASGDTPDATQAVLKAVEAAEAVRAQFRSEEFKTGLFGEAQEVFDRAVVQLLDAGEVARAFEVSERGRSRALVDLIRDRVGRATGHVDQPEPPVTVASLQEALPSGAVLIEYHTLPDRTVAWVIRRDRVDLFKAALGRPEVASRARVLRAAWRNRSPEAEDLSRALRRDLVPQGIAGADLIIIVPHGPLHYIPFQALRGESAYLVEQAPIVSLPTAKLVLRKSGGDGTTPTSLLALGNPDLGLPALDLPGAEREVQAIKDGFANATALLRKEANRPGFLKLASGAAAVHVAAHADVDELDPLQSVLRLSPTSGDNGEVSARDLYAMNLGQVALVTLSACETGLGRIGRGDEIWGFTRTVLAAGASGLTVSMWPVADDATALLMSGFYERLHKMSAPKALQKAQLALLADERFKDPFFWAPFVYMGAW